MSEVAEKAAEVTAEVVEESIDGVVENLEVIRTRPGLVVAAGVVGLTIGGVGGYFIAKKKLKAVYEDLASREIAEAKAFYATLNKVDPESGDVLSPMEVLEKTHPEAAASLREYQGRPINGPYETEEDLIAASKDEQGGPWDEEMDAAQLAKIEARLIEERAEPDKVTVEEEVVETVNVFSDPTFDLVEESKFRTPDSPYVISHDEYFNTDREYDNIALTYYESDDTLVNEQDNPVNEIDKLVGDEALARFGHGSKDKNIVYVRNEKLETDFEITRSTGSYLVEVLGLDPEPEPNSLKHSADRRRDFRRGMD